MGKLLGFYEPLNNSGTWYITDNFVCPDERLIFRQSI